MLQFCASWGHTFNLVNFYFYFKNRNKSNCLHISCLYRCLAVLFYSYLLSNIFTLFCRNLTFVNIFALFRVKLFWMKPCLCKNIVFFHVCLLCTRTLYPYQGYTIRSSDSVDGFLVKYLTNVYLLLKML